jgi:hypothetical protein
MCSTSWFLCSEKSPMSKVILFLVLIFLREAFTSSVTTLQDVVGWYDLSIVWIVFPATGPNLTVRIHCLSIVHKCRSTWYRSTYNTGLTNAGSPCTPATHTALLHSSTPEPHRHVLQCSTALPYHDQQWGDCVRDTPPDWDIQQPVCRSECSM